MGTCISKDKNEHAKYGFSAEEFEQIETIYQSISEQKFRYQPSIERNMNLSQIS